MSGIVSFVNWPEIISDQSVSMIWPRFLTRLIQRPSLLPGMVSLGAGSNKSSSFFGKVCKFYSRTDRALLTIRHTDQILGRGVSPYTVQTKNYSSLCIYFIIQIPPFIDWVVVHTRKVFVAMAEMAQSLLVDLALSDKHWSSHHWAIICSIGVQSFCAQWHSDVTKIHTAPTFFNIYVKVCNESDPWFKFDPHHAM